jgi:outer membrane protein assembly factor BamB
MNRTFLIFATLWCCSTSFAADSKLEGGVHDQSQTDRVRWRFTMEGQYSFVRPAIGPKGTIYAIDNEGHLYALTPNGKLLWRFDGAGNKGVAVSQDNTIYTASESDIKAIRADGKLRWQFNLVPQALITLGVAVGPDQNIYCVATESLGLFSLTPQGQLRWATPEHYVRPPVDYGEIVFGKNGNQQQLYFYANGRIRGVRLSDGQTVFPTETIEQPYGQPDVSPLDQTVHANVLSYTPNGDLRWLLFNIFPSSAGFPAANVGMNGVHYVVYPARRLYAIRPEGSIQYQVDFSQDFGDPVVSPTNSILVIGTVNWFSGNSFVGFNPNNGVEEWRVPLPDENGLPQSITTRARFSLDGLTAYLHTAVFDDPNGHAFLYAINARSAD